MAAAHQSACSFCGKSRTKVRDLIASRRVSPAHICDECVGVCAKILAEDKAEDEATGKTMVPFGPPFRDPNRLRQGLHCSFCRRPQEFVCKLISSPAGAPRRYICDRCVRIAARLLRKVNHQDQRQAWGLAGWLERWLTLPPARLHHMR